MTKYITKVPKTKKYVKFLWKETKKHKPKKMNIKKILEQHKNESCWEKKFKFFTFLKHAKRVQDANLDYPVIITPSGWILDGMHRLTKAILLEKKKIRVILVKKMSKKALKRGFTKKEFKELGIKFS